MGRERIQILDGGMGTTLEALGHSVNSELWGSELLYTNPKIMANIHEKYVQAGADLVETCTYQLTSENLTNYLNSNESSSDDPTTSDELFYKSIDLVDCAFKKNNINSINQGVVFSCGPFGSTLKPGAEYSGIYPFPFGPISNQQNSFNKEDKLLEKQSIELLSKFHFEKLLKIALNKEIWKKIKWIGFETIPLIYEIKSIRLAIGKLNKILKNKYKEEKEEQNWFLKKFWITSPFPNSNFPQIDLNGNHITIKELINNLIDYNYNNEIETENDEYPIPNGIGINCTNPSYLFELSKQFTNILKEKNEIKQNSISFILYPDGGQIYDVITRSWSIPKNEFNSNSNEWSKGILKIIKKIENSKQDNGEYIWKSIIVGGCCKTSFNEIKSLKMNLDNMYGEVKSI
ncbi:uncharacterized protein I206_102028 [Kwoniella pini CBS 10737]|uniref:Hcy-binding domain-containing protein n=1 Tax=Kwoniella pini CBS 10737 TaxID=1296096 RepID=A0A1B9HV10_9TREE|nr:uncharacterized protein I206_06880 [Kwoniella pini CBS 10737]OCF47104.1 hypothetical protein I206_06880 [Kwoniella pini CBS 10737]